MNSRPKEDRCTFTPARRASDSCVFQFQPSRAGVGRLRVLCSVALGMLAMFSSTSAAPLEFRPKITTQPRNVAALEGEAAVLYVRACGAGKLTFQWLRDQVPLPKADEPVLRLDSLSASQAGNYQLVVSSPYGKVTSDVARVTLAAEAGFTPAVFSCNAVGYINHTLQPGFSLLINQFAWGNSGPGAGVVSNVLGALPTGMAIYQVGPDGFKANAMAVNWTKPDAPLNLGAVFFMLNPFGVPFTLTMVGAVAEGDLQQALPAGYSIAGSLVPQAGAVSTDLLMPAAEGDQVWRWSPQTQTYLEYRLPADGWQPAEPGVSLLEAFVVRKSTPVVWRRFFTVNLLGGCPPNLGGGLARVPLPATTGQVHFFAYLPDLASGRLNSDYFGQLYAGVSMDENELSPCGVPVRFPDDAREGYLDGGMVTTPGLPAGRIVQTQLRIWSALDGATYEEAAATGCFTAKSELVPTLTGAPLIDGRPGIPPWPVGGFSALRLPQIPNVVIEPANGVVPIGQSVTLSAAGTGAAPTGFLWRHNGVAIPGANGPQLQLSNVQRADAGEYSVIVSNGACALSSTNARLAVYQPIKILEQPAGIDRIAGEPAAFAVLATGDSPLNYRWHTSVLNPLLSEQLLSANTNTLVISNVVDVSEGDYWVEVRSLYESVASTRASLTVTNYLHMALDTPTWRYVTSGDKAWQVAETTHVGRSNTAIAGPMTWNNTASMQTQIEGPGVVTFWWATTARDSANALRLSVDDVPKASLYNAPGWEFGSVALPSGSHQVEWRSHCTFPEAQPLTAWVDSVQLRAGMAPKILGNSSDYWFVPGEGMELSVVATGDDPLRYQWFAGPNPIPGEADPLLELRSWQINSEVPYSVTVSNYFGAVTSGPMMLRPRPRLRIETEPAGTFRLVWPREVSQFVLEASADLMGADSWRVVTQPVVLTETECAVSLPREPGTNQWFRLRLP